MIESDSRSVVSQTWSPYEDDLVDLHCIYMGLAPFCLKIPDEEI